MAVIVPQRYMWNIDKFEKCLIFEIRLPVTQKAPSCSPNPPISKLSISKLKSTTLGVIERPKSQNNFPMARSINSTGFASNKIKSCMENIQTQSIYHDFHKLDICPSSKISVSNAKFTYNVCLCHIIRVVGLNSLRFLDQARTNCRYMPYWWFPIDGSYYKYRCTDQTKIYAWLIESVKLANTLKQ